MRPGPGAMSRPVLAALLTGLAVVVMPAPARAGSATDPDFVRRVHLSVLSAGPASAIARGAAGQPSIRSLAARVGSQEAQLDSLARSTAGTLAVALTDQLPADQQTALATLQKNSGRVLETAYVDLLWTIDSALIPIAMTVHATTGDAAVRRLAERVDSVLGAQLPQLQKSGLLRMPLLPTPPASAVARLPGGVPMDPSLMAQTRSGSGFLSPTLRVRLLVLAAAAGTAGAVSWRLLHRPGRRRGRRFR